MGQGARIRAEQLGVGVVRNVPAPSDSDAGVCWLRLDPDVSIEPVTQAAEAILSGHYHFLSYGEPPPRPFAARGSIRVAAL